MLYLVQTLPTALRSTDNLALPLLIRVVRVYRLHLWVTVATVTQFASRQELDVLTRTLSCNHELGAGVIGTRIAVSGRAAFLIPVFGRLKIAPAAGVMDVALVNFLTPFRV